jgi:WhiB family transcriptional regulator, redox-sensing transcriptional regulator
MSWQDQALCLRVAGKRFFVEDGRHAKAVCALCPVWRPCLDGGLDEPEGIWGGLRPVERGRLRRLLRRLAATPTDPQNATDVRRLVAAGLSPERLSAVTGIGLDTVTAWVAARPRTRRRTEDASRSVGSAGSP